MYMVVSCRLVLLAMILQQSWAIPNKIIIMDQQFTEPVSVDGATVQSEEYYSGMELFTSVTIKPHRSFYRLMVQFMYLDIEKTSPCHDTLSICELLFHQKHWRNIPCHFMLLSKTCGDFRNLYPELEGKDGMPLHINTITRGSALRVQWITSHKRPQLQTGAHRGFQLSITAFTEWPMYSCDRNTSFLCADRRCISSDLVCDMIRHCLDASDEKNCSHKYIPEPMCVKNNCAVPIWWDNTWWGLIIPLPLTCGLALVAAIIRCYKYFRRQANRQQGQPNVQHQESQTYASSWRADINSLYAQTELCVPVMPPIPQPPPYTLEDTALLPTSSDGEPPPPYEDDLLPPPSTPPPPIDEPPPDFDFTNEPPLMSPMLDDDEESTAERQCRDNQSA